MKLSDSGHGDYEQPEPGSYAGVCFKLIDLGTQTSEYQSKPNVKRKMVIAWELDEKMKDGKPFIVQSFYTQSLHENATLRAHLEAWRGKPFTAEELQGFESKNLLGKACLLSLVKNDKGNVRVGGVAKLPKGMTAHVCTHDNVYFTMDPNEYDPKIYESLSDGFKKMIALSPEFRMITGAETIPAVTNDASEDVPF